MTIPEEIERLLRGVVERDEEAVSQALAALKDLKLAAIAAANQALTKRIWCLEQAFNVQGLYLRAFRELKTGRYYDGWCTLEQVELGFLSLERHLADQSDHYRLRFIQEHTERLQSLFPYKLFLSPEILELEKRCSTCDSVVSLRNPCGHRVGEIFNGEMCHRVVTMPRVMGMAIVEKPVQKYSVLFLTDPKTRERVGHHDYTAVRYVVERLRSAFDGWDVRITKRRHPHDRFSHIGRNDRCPCESNLKYKRCCLLEEGVLRPHYEVTFHVAPPSESMGVEYSG